jgi:hypothetical protein
MDSVLRTRTSNCRRHKLFAGNDLRVLRGHPRGYAVFGRHELLRFGGQRRRSRHGFVWRAVRNIASVLAVLLVGMEGFPGEPFYVVN